MRLTLQRGLEVIRLAANHGVSVDLAVHLSRSFEARAAESKVPVKHICELERATAYWRTSTEMMENLLR